MTAAFADSETKSSALAHYGIVLAAAAALMLWRLGGTALDGHEAYVALAAQTMADGRPWLDRDVADGPVPPETALNRWLVPVFNGEPRLVKTPLAYWCVAGLLKLGLPADEFTARLPSALAAIALALVTLALGRSVLPPRAALLGALMLATSLALTSWGRNARGDMPMTLGMTATMACAWWGLHQPTALRRGALLLAAWAALGAANLAKEFAPLLALLPVALLLCWRASLGGDAEHPRPRRLLAGYLLAAAAGLVLCALVRTVAPLQWWRWFGLSETVGMAGTVAACAGLPLAGYALVARAWPQVRLVLPTALPGAALMVALFVPWLVYIYRTFPQAGQVLAHQTTERAMGTGGWLEHSAAPLSGYYVRSLAKWSLPWVALLPGAVAVPFVKRFGRDREGLGFLLLWIFALVMLFSMSVGKHEQYIIPAVPPACLLMGFCAEDVFFRHRWFGPRVAGGIYLGYAAAVLLAGAGALGVTLFAHGDARSLAAPLPVIAGAALVPLAAGTVALLRGRTALAVGTMLAAAALAELAAVSFARTWDRAWEDYARFARAVTAEVPADQAIASWEKPNPALVWYAGRELPRLDRLRARFERLHGAGRAEAPWRRWLADAGPAWVIAAPDAAEQLAALGYADTGRHAGSDDKEVALFHRTPHAAAP